MKLSESFNNHFASVGPELANEIPCTANNRSHLSYLTGVKCDGKFKMKSTNSSTVLSLLRKLCKNKATGLDKISVRLIHECADLIADSLCSILNCSIATGIFPEDWKSSKDFNNYRPISIIPVIAKVFERVVYDQIFAFLNENKLLSPYQSRFRCLHFTVTAVLEATDSWAYDIDRGNINAVVFLDLKKAFDTVDHEILLSKLNKYGIEDMENMWFKSYLNNRNQKCFVNGYLSQNRSLACGIPQGTILGPLLFILYINDLPNCLSYTQPRMYADDTNLSCFKSISA